MNIKKLKTVKIAGIILISLLFFVTIADALEYTVTPSKNLGKIPGTPFADEKVTEAQPVPVAFVMILTVFPQLTSINLELLFLIKGIIYTGYIKIKKRADGSIKRKEELYNLIKENPGLHYREIQRKSFLKNGTFEYHINQMESEGLIKSIKDKNKVRYFTTSFEISPDNLKYISVMNTESLRKIIFLIYFNVSMNNTEIINQLELSKSVISENLKYLCKTNIIETERKGKFTYYTISDKYSDRIFEYISNKSMIDKNIFSTNIDESSG